MPNHPSRRRKQIMNIATNNDSVLSRYQQNQSIEKVLGAVSTPPRLAASMVRWAVRTQHDRVLDPSCGDGVFLAAARTHLADLGNKHPVCVGVDINPEAALIAGGINGDFFEWVRTAPLFDAIIGNPPFVRSHLFDERSRLFAFKQMEALQLHPSRLMSTRAPFVSLSAKLLTPEGRMALVVPEEILHVGYAKELRTFLLERFKRVIVCLANGDLFPSVQQSVVILLCDNESHSEPGLHSMSFVSLEEGPPYESEPAPLWKWNSKWTHLFLSLVERELVNDHFGKLRWKPLNKI